MSSTVVGAHSGAGPLSLMSCVRESSPPQDIGSEFENERNVGSKKKFWNPKKWFKRKHKVIEDGGNPIDISEPNKEAARSRSTSELSISEDTVKRRSSTSMHPGLSVSHDSVFHSPNSGSELELDNAQSTSSLSISHQHQDLRFQSELSERLRSRRGRGDTSEDDEGLPHSPCNSPTTTEGLLEKTAIKDHPTKSHSTCSDGSLLSMGSSEMDEDSFGQHSRHSSKLSLHEKHEKRSYETDSDFEFGPNNLSIPLNHSAAHHKVAVRPKRTHGAPRRKRPQQLSVNALPATPEVNEDTSIRSLTPEGSTSREIITEIYSSTSQSRTHTITETQLKCSSLPPGLAPPGADLNKLNRSCSNAGSKSQEHFLTVGEEDEDREEKSDKSFFDRIFPRRSAKKKKSKEEKEKHITSISVVNSSHSYAKHSENTFTSVVTNRSGEKRPNVIPRTGAAARQRVQPIDIPASPDLSSNREETTLPPKTPEKLSVSTSPLQAELENHFRNRLSTSPLSSSPPKISVPKTESPQHSPVSPVFTDNGFSLTTSEDQTNIKHIKQYESSRESRLEELKNKVKFPGLSALQERVLSLQDESEENSFKSLIELPVNIKTNKPVIKSHSFKSVKSVFDVTNKITQGDCNDRKNNEKTSTKCEIKGSIMKASSLDSIKNLDDIKSENIKPVSEVNENFKEIGEITISGPSHTAILTVNNPKTDIVDSKSEYKQTEKEVIEKSSEIRVKDHQVSVTKIHVKREMTQFSGNTVTVAKNAIPEFLNKPLNKIENRPVSNVVFTTTSPRIIDEQSRPKTVFNFDAEKELPFNLTRKFSKDDVEIVDKEINEEIVEVPSKTASSLFKITSMTPQPATRMYKKHSETQRKSSLVNESTVKEKPALKIKSASLEIVEPPKKSPDISDGSNKSSLDSLDKLDDSVKSETSDNVENVVRRKSVIKRKTDDEPELMKVFARRSLKLKDSEIDAVSKQLENIVQENPNDLNTKSRDSDKENHVDSPPEERKKSLTITKEVKKEAVTEIAEHRKSVTTKEIKPKEPLTESKFVETSEVTLRKPSNNKTFAYQRALIMNLSKPVEVVNTELKVKKQASFSDRPKTESWLTNVKNHETEKSDKEERITSEIITDISPKSDFINEEEFSTKPKNFNQRKAEWEKRAQEALKKNVP